MRVYCMYCKPGLSVACSVCVCVVVVAAMFVAPPIQADQNLLHHQAASDPGLTEENINLLGEDGLRAGGQQALRLG